LYDLASIGFMCSLFRNRFRKNSLRYTGRDYSLPGKYFVTICTAHRTKWFGCVINGEMHLSEIGQIASRMWYEIPVHFPFIGLDAFVVMPNHIHGIVVINRSVKPWIGSLHATILPPPQPQINKIMSSISPKSGSLSVVVRSYKSAITKHSHKLDSSFSWQPNFHDNIICTKGQLSRIRKYISENPQRYRGN
jgi:putative transposase